MIGIALFLLAAGWAGAYPQQPQPAAGAASPSAPVITRVPAGWRASEPLARGVERWARGKKAEAVLDFAAAVRQNPSDPIAWHDLGVGLLDAGKARDAFTAFSNERFYTASAPSAWSGMGFSRLKLGDYAGAENDFIMALVAAPREWLNWHGLSHAQAALGKTEAAREASRRAALLRPPPPRAAWTTLGIQRAIRTARIPSIRTVR